MKAGIQVDGGSRGGVVQAEQRQLNGSKAGLHIFM
jgi:hypothetical protein